MGIAIITKYGNAMADSNRRIFWADLSFWDNWPKLENEKLLTHKSTDGYAFELYWIGAK